MLPVQGFVKNYHWGKVGEDNYIARFQTAALSTTNTINVNTSSHESKRSKQDQVDTSKPFAELWFGSHPSGPASIIVGDQRIRLDAFLAKQPEMVCAIDRYQKFNKTLPFLFKILSVGQPLSLQAHPDRKLAQILHQKDPKNYPDANHKPELAIALTEFEVLCDFRPIREIAQFMTVLKPLRLTMGERNYEHLTKTVIGNNNNSPSRNIDDNHKRRALAECFKALLTCDKEIIIRETKNLLSNPENLNKVDKNLMKLVGDLDKLYPGDPGVFAPFFLNYLKLSPGQAVYLKANKLHAYLKGECIECMACSDNVVRAGLTTKYRDVETLLTMLDYEPVKSTSDILLAGLRHPSDPAIISFAPTEEFKVDKISITQKNAPHGEYNLSPLESGSFFIILGGKASTRNFFDLDTEHRLCLGSAGFVPPKIALKLTHIQGTLTIYRSYC